MSTPLKRLRRTFPALTPPFVPEDDIPKIWRLGDPLLRREPPPQIVPPVLTRTITPPVPEPIAPSMPTRISDEQLNQIGAPPPLLRRSMGEPLPNVAGAPPLPSWDAGEVLTRDSRDPYGELSPPPIPSRLASMAPPPVMMLSRGGHPVSAVGGIDALDADRQLLRTQQSERPRRESKKMIALRTGLGFLFGGIPGAAQTLVGDAMDRRALDRGRINRNIGDTQQRIGQELLVRKTQNDLLNDQTDRNYKGAQLQRLSQQPQEQERDNLRQLYNSLPYFDAAKNPQHQAIAERAKDLGIVLPNREEKDSTTIEKVNGQFFAVNKKTGQAAPVTQDGKPLVSQADVPTKVTIDGQEFNVSQSQGANALATRGRQQYQIEKDQENLVREDEDKSAEARSLIEQSQSARVMGDELDKQLRASGGLYEQRGEIQGVLSRGYRQTGGDLDEEARKELRAQLSTLNSRIAQIEQGRNSHYSNADRLRGQATKYRPVRAPRRISTGSSTGGRGRNYVAPKVSKQRLEELLK